MEVDYSVTASTGKLSLLQLQETLHSMLTLQLRLRLEV